MNAREEHIAVSRSARLFVLGEPSAARDVWIVCHGYGQLARRFIREFEPISAPDRLIVAPEGLHRFYIDPPPLPAVDRRVGATWMTREDREHDIADYVAYLDRVADYLSARVRGPHRLVGLGFSQGCSTLFRWAAKGRARIDELILWAGEVPHDVDMDEAAHRLARARISLVRGSDDRMIPSGRATHDQAALRAAGLSCEICEYHGGHEIDAALLTTIAEETSLPGRRT